MFNMLKNTYCFYIAQIILKCKNSNELNTKLDLLIDNNKINEVATGDDDLVNILKHVCNYRAFHRESKEYEVHTKDGQIKDFLTPNRTLKNALHQRKIDYNYVELEGNHTWKTWKPDLPNAIMRIFHK